MAIACPVDLDTLKLRAEIQSIYARVAENPSGDFHFHRGPEYAARRLNYDAAEVSQLPGGVTDSVAGAGNTRAIADRGAGRRQRKRCGYRSPAGGVPSGATRTGDRCRGDGGDARSSAAR